MVYLCLVVFVKLVCYSWINCNVGFGLLYGLYLWFFVLYFLSCLWVIKRFVIFFLEGNIGNLKKEVSKFGYICIRNKIKLFFDDMVICFNILFKEDKF